MQAARGNWRGDKKRHDLDPCSPWKADKNKLCPCFKPSAAVWSHSVSNTHWPWVERVLLSAWLRVSALLSLAPGWQGYGCSKLAPACHTLVATCHAHKTRETMDWMAEGCEDINSERVIGRREGNGPVKGWRWTPLQGAGARRQHVGQGRKTVRSLQTQKGATGSPQS